MDFTGNHVVITGASTGIGTATAYKIASLGGKVTLIAPARRSARAPPCARSAGASYIAAMDNAVAGRNPRTPIEYRLIQDENLGGCPLP